MALVVSMERSEKELKKKRTNTKWKYFKSYFDDCLANFILQLM